MWQMQNEKPEPQGSEAHPNYEERMAVMFKIWLEYCDPCLETPDVAGMQSFSLVGLVISQDTCILKMQ